MFLVWRTTEVRYLSQDFLSQKILVNEPEMPTRPMFPTYPRTELIIYIERERHTHTYTHIYKIVKYLYETGIHCCKLFQDFHYVKLSPWVAAFVHRSLALTRGRGKLSLSTLWLEDLLISVFLLAKGTAESGFQLSCRSCPTSR